MINQLPTQEEIAVCAFFIYLNEGRPANREEEHWRQAEFQLIAARIHDAMLTSTPEDTDVPFAPTRKKGRGKSSSASSTKKGLAFAEC